MLTLESILTFGKHEGEQVEDVIIDDEDYMIWLVEKTEMEFDDEVLDLLYGRAR